MPLFKSLRSRKSTRNSTASSTITTNGTTEKNTDFGPVSNSSTTYGSVRSSKTAPPPVKAEVSSPIKQSAPPPSLPRHTSSSSFAGQNGSAITGGGLMRSFSEVAPPLDSRVESTAEVGPRPSELFAGKGVQWGAVKLAGPNITPIPVPATNNTEDMQDFLKRRRQWKPTFATEDDNEKLDKEFKPPKDLSQLSFASGDKVTSQGLMSFKELEESHKRKEQLLNAAPLGGSLWDEAETSKAASARAAKLDATSAPQEAPTYTRKPSNLRQSSYKSTGSIKSAKRFFGGLKDKSTASQAAVPVPPRDSSARQSTGASTTTVKDGGALGVTGLAPPISAADLDRSSALALESNGTASVLSNERESGASLPTQQVMNDSIADGKETPGRGAGTTATQEAGHGAAVSQTGTEAALDDAAGKRPDTEIMAQEDVTAASKLEAQSVDAEIPSEEVETAVAPSDSLGVVNADKHADQEAIVDADTTLTTSDAGKVAVADVKEEETSGVSMIPKESDVQQEATMEDVVTEQAQIAHSGVTDVVPASTS